MINPINDDSRWTVLSARFETPPFIVDSMKTLLREAYGDELADALEATIPPPHGTLVLP